jgi:SMI1 / KNR4 family (SUKH-1)
MAGVADLLVGEKKDWSAHVTPRPEQEIESATRRIGLSLPPKLLEMYRLCDGGEGSLPKQPYIFVLWGINEVAQLREDEHYREHYDRYVFFGGNGAGEYFGVDEAGRVFFMDAVAGEESITVYCDTFDEFVAQIGIPSDQESMR